MFIKWDWFFCWCFNFVLIFSIQHQQIIEFKISRTSIIFNKIKIHNNQLVVWIVTSFYLITFDWVKGTSRQEKSSLQKIDGLLLVCHVNIFCSGLSNLMTSHNLKVSIISFTLSEVRVSFLPFSFKLSNRWIITVLKSPPTSKSWSLKVSKLVSSVFKKWTSSLFGIC